MGVTKCLKSFQKSEKERFASKVKQCDANCLIRTFYLLKELALGWAFVWWWDVCGFVLPTVSATWRRGPFPVPVEWWQLQFQEQLRLQVPRGWVGKSETLCYCTQLLTAGNLLTFGALDFSWTKTWNWIEIIESNKLANIKSAVEPNSEMQTGFLTHLLANFKFMNTLYCILCHCCGLWLKPF